LRTLRGLWCLGAALAHVLRGVMTCAFVFPWLTPVQRMQRVGTWSRRLLRVLRVDLIVSGAPRPGPLLLVANHVSWLDILVINAVHPVRFVSKADVRAWPVIGWLVACGGTLFIERERKRDAMRVVHQMAEALQAGQQLAIFPEGTTTDGTSLMPFHANLLQAAIATETPAQPVALRFADSQHAVSPAAAYVGDTNLVQSAWAIVTTTGLRAEISFGPAQGTRHLDRRALARLLSERIGHALGIEAER